jgi:hypothetical protein
MSEQEFIGGILALTAIVVNGTLAWLNYTERKGQERLDAQYRLLWATRPQAKRAAVHQPTQLTRPHWATVLNVALPVTKDEIRQAYRSLSKQRHPDAGGSDELMKELSAAQAQALSWLEENPGPAGAPFVPNS